MTAPRFDLIVVSPHLDDAVFSCGGAIHARARQGASVLIVTPFAGDPPAAPLSALARELHTVWGLADDPLRVRREEDRLAAERLGAMPLHWDYPDALYRQGDGGPLYPTLRLLRAAPHHQDGATLAELTADLRRLPPAPTVLAPLAAGGHVDHRLCHLAACAAFKGRALWFYEDWPYGEHFFVLRRALRPRRRFVRRVEVLSRDDLLAKSDAVLCYPSQLVTIASDPQRVVRRIRRHARRRGGERLWSRSGGEHG